jgi:hypothetical protein
MESDSEFLDSMEAWVTGSLVFKKEHRDRLFALARRGAAMQEPWPEGFFRVGRLITERCATEGCGQTPSMRLEINDTGSYYCEPCARKIARIVTKYPLPPPPKGADE